MTFAVEGKQWKFLVSMGGYNALLFGIMAFVTLYSLRKIAQDSKSINELGIRTNQLLMWLYAISWISFDLNSWTYFVIEAL
mmetsp:Transcript_1795/g.2550  ORF Transcript_1795/g.2550 Transcript_1795/m.2550 type:complete len:81 (+) Transcript_1795:500-742(+)